MLRFSQQVNVLLELSTNKDRHKTRQINPNGVRRKQRGNERDAADGVGKSLPRGRD